MPKIKPIYCGKDSFSLKKKIATTAERIIPPPEIIGNITEAAIESDNIITNKLTAPFETPQIKQLRKPFFILLKRFMRS